MSTQITLYVYYISTKNNYFLLLPPSQNLKGISQGLFKSQEIRFKTLTCDTLALGKWSKITKI